MNVVFTIIIIRRERIEYISTSFVVYYRTCLIWKHLEIMFYTSMNLVDRIEQK